MKQYLRIRLSSGKLSFLNTIRVKDMQESYDQAILIIDQQNQLVLFGDTWVPAEQYNQYVESGEALRLTSAN